MFNRTRCLQVSAALASISLLAGCGLFSDDSGDKAKRIVVGTTSAPSTLDPAAAWDGSWELYRNVYQTLLAFPTGSTKPQPDAAQNCDFTDTANTAYRCTLRKGLKFSDGEPLDAKPSSTPWTGSGRSTRRSAPRASSTPSTRSRPRTR